MIALGVDPGLTGAISLLDSGRGLLECADIPTSGNGTASGSMQRWVDVAALAEILDTWSVRHSFARESVHAFLERPIAMPRLPSQTIASQFDTFGVIRALICSRPVWGTRARFVNPQEWKRFFGLGSEKDASRKVCLRLYPDAPITRAKDHNRAESLLIAHYGMRQTA